MKVYLDHAATTPVLSEVLDYMYPFFSEKFGNASSIHLFGKEAKEALEHERKSISEIINCQPDEIYFTSGGTESDNIAILGLSRETDAKTLFISCIEHEAVIEPAIYLRSQGYNVYIIPVDKCGIIDIQYVLDNLKDDTYLISVMLANNEVGVVQPLKELIRHTREKGIVFHTDAVQAMGKMKIDVQDLGIDMLSASSHKFYGPKGAGFLYIRRGLPVAPVVFGGGHEKALRSGTENVSGIVGMGEALRICCRDYETYHSNYVRWKEMIIKGLSDTDGFTVNQCPKESLPNILNISFRGLNGESIAEMLSLQGIAVSTASACSSHKHEHEHEHDYSADKEGEANYSRVLKAMSIPEDCSRGAIRISTGIDNNDEQINYFIKSLKNVVARLRSFSDGF